MTASTMKVQQIEVSKLKPYKNNPRHNDRTIAMVAESIKTFGFQQPIVVDEKMVIIAGHTRLEAAKSLGLKKVPVCIADLPPNLAKQYRLADNKIAEASDWDMPALKIELQSIVDADGLEAAVLTGFDEGELARILSGDPPATDDDGQANEAVISYIMVFDDEKQKERFYDFLRKLKDKYPQAETAAQRVDEFLSDNSEAWDE